MKDIRRLAVFPVELLLMLVVAIYAATEVLADSLGRLCRLIEGEQ